MNDPDLGKGRILPLTLSLCIPTALSQAVMVLYSIVDRAFIGHIPQVGDLALAAVGVSAPLTSLVTAFGMLVGLGGAPLMEMKEGAGERESAERFLSSALFILIIFSLFLTPVMISIRRPLLYLFGASSETIGYAHSYLFYYLLGTPAALLVTGLNYFLIAQGRSRQAMISVLTGALLNILLDPLFIFTFAQGVRGGAIATVISQYVSALITVCSLSSKRCRIRIKSAKPEREEGQRILKNGTSPFIIAFTDSLLFLVLNASLQQYGGEGYGDMLLAASTIVLSYYQLSMNPLIGITGGSQGIISFNYGAGNSRRVTEAYRAILVISLAYTTLMTVLTYIAGPAFISFFTQDEALKELTFTSLKRYTLFMIPLSFHYVNVDTFTALAQVKLSLPLSLFRKAVYLLSCILLPSIFGASSTFFSEPVSDISAAVVSSIVMYIQLPRILREREEKGVEA